MAKTNSESKKHKTETFHTEFELRDIRDSTPYDVKVSNFKDYLSANPADVAQLMNCFGPNPTIGITSDGPIYKGRKQVDDLFNAIERTFPKFCFEESGRYGCNTGKTDANQEVAVTLTGTLKGNHNGEAWNPGFDSSPLNGVTKTGRSFRSLAACCIFCFPKASTNSDLITSLSIYFDRYQMLNQLGLVR